MDNPKPIARATTVEIESSTQRPTKVQWYKRIGSFLGFRKTYNLALVIVFCGAMLSFYLIKVHYLYIDRAFSKNAAVAEWYWYREGHNEFGFTLHLACNLLTWFLMVLQFLSTARHRRLNLHRIISYIIIFLVFLSNVGILTIVRQSFGGDVSSQSAIGMLVILTTVSVVTAYTNVKRLQIDQHRAWMLRAMFYLAVMVTARILLMLSALITSSIGLYYTVWRCSEVLYLAQQESHNSSDYMIKNYPGCFNGSGSPFIPSNAIAIKADLYSSQVENVSAALRLNFGQTVWIALILHVVGAEHYLALTSRESLRLKTYAFKRQSEAGMKQSGSARLVFERFGELDPWKVSGDVS